MKERIDVIEDMMGEIEERSDELPKEYRHTIGTLINEMSGVIDEIRELGETDKLETLDLDVVEKRLEMVLEEMDDG